MFAVKTDSRATINLVRLEEDVKKRGGRWSHRKTSKVLTKEELASWLAQAIGRGHHVTVGYEQHRATLVVFDVGSWHRVSHLIYVQAR